MSSISSSPARKTNMMHDRLAIGGIIAVNPSDSADQTPVSATRPRLGVHRRHPLLYRRPPRRITLSFATRKNAVVRSTIAFHPVIWFRILQMTKCQQHLNRQPRRRTKSSLKKWAMRFRFNNRRKPWSRTKLRLKKRGMGSGLKNRGNKHWRQTKTRLLRKKRGMGFNIM